MSRRAKHRYAEAAARAARAADGLPADPSNRTRNPAEVFGCPIHLRVQFIREWQFRLHVFLHHSKVSAR